MPSKSPLTLFPPPVRAWFDAVFPAPTRPRQLGWPALGLGISRPGRALEFLKRLAAEGRPRNAADARAALELFPEKHAG
jgi:hypothetical protein